MATTTLYIGDLHKEADARDERIAELEQRERQAWLAAWGAEWRAQRPAWRENARLRALLRRAEAALMLADDALSYLGHANSGGCSEVAATLAAIRQQREVQP